MILNTNRNRSRNGNRDSDSNIDSNNTPASSLKQSPAAKQNCKGDRKLQL